MTALTLNTHHELKGITAFDDQHRKPMQDYADKLADAAGAGLDLETARRYARGSFALGLLLLGMPDEDDEEEEGPDEAED